MSRGAAGSDPADLPEAVKTTEQNTSDTVSTGQESTVGSTAHMTQTAGIGDSTGTMQTQAGLTDNRVGISSPAQAGQQRTMSSQILTRSERRRIIAASARRENEVSKNLGGPSVGPETKNEAVAEQCSGAEPTPGLEPATTDYLSTEVPSAALEADVSQHSSGDINDVLQSSVVPLMIISNTAIPSNSFVQDRVDDIESKCVSGKKNQHDSRDDGFRAASTRSSIMLSAAKSVSCRSDDEFSPEDTQSESSEAADGDDDDDYGSLKPAATRAAPSPVLD